MFKVYGKTNCPSCTSAKQLLETKGCEYEYLLFGKDYDLSKFVHINKNQRPKFLDQEYILSSS